ncbi:hypothetical protein AS850_07740 [Frondihabitans sp. 762G35]|uniref:hypothetical protein n=1 Tax=Frondihabitans sp. 762G35 TaxID=1446794 RepID=UPI000D22AC0C|nr:hypothetical protein [Frondihabitans sp. 762G35]ARC56969.1 hypothetical protein AS850_07740 [Frondihabitans sp. 762G35]
MDGPSDSDAPTAEPRGGRSDVAPFVMSLFVQAVVSFLGYFTLVFSMLGVAGCQAPGDPGRCNDPVLDVLLPASSATALALLGLSVVLAVICGATGRPFSRIPLALAGLVVILSVVAIAVGQWALG